MLGWRHVVTGLGFFGFYVIYSLRVNLSVAMVAMVNHTAIGENKQKDINATDYCSYDPNQNSSNTKFGTQLLQEDGEFVWDEATQGIILGSFFYGYLVTQVPAGWLAGRFGGKWVFGLGTLWTAILSMLTPVAASAGVGYFVALRILMGIGEVGCLAGTVVSFIASGYLSSSSFLGGWPSVFYVFGFIGCVWFIFWAIFVSDGPSNHRWISEKEKKYIMTKISKEKPKKKGPAVATRNEVESPAEGGGSKKPTPAKTKKRESSDEYKSDTDSLTTASLRRSNLPRRPPDQSTELHLNSFLRDHLDVAVAMKTAGSGKEVMNFNYAQFINARGKAPALEKFLDTVNEKFVERNTMVIVRAPVIVVGDIHGQFLDLYRVLMLGGWPSQKRYLFLGDYVDRGSHSLECIFFLFALLLKYPRRVVLLRGNHECQHVNTMYGFLDECQRRLSNGLYHQFQSVFNNMPLAARINRQILCMHGGISPEIKSFDDINRIRRPTDAFDAVGITADLLWSDPDFDQPNWKEGCRGTGWLFGEKALRDFLRALNLQMIIRAHQVVQQGYQFFGHKQLITVFTAPNYCNEFANDGAFLLVSKDLKIQVKILQSSKDENQRETPINYPNFAN